MKNHAKFMHVLVAILDCEIEAFYDSQQDKGACVSSSNNS